MIDFLSVLRDLMKKGCQLKYLTGTIILIMPEKQKIQVGDSNVLAFLIWLVFLPINTILFGFALKTLWGWFFVTTFGLPVLGIVQAIGIAYTIRFFVIHPVLKTKDERSLLEQVIEGGVSEFVYPLFIMGLGWIIHQFM